MPVRAYLYDADGTDREVTLDASLAADLSDRHLLWVDISAYEESELRQVAALFDLRPESVHHLMNPVRRPRVDNYGLYLQLNVAALHEDSQRYTLREIDFVVGPNYVITVHQEPISFLESFDRRVKADSQLGKLEAAAFLAALLDWHLTGYFRAAEQFEAEVDTLVTLVLRDRFDEDLLSQLATLQRRVGQVRHGLTPHREVYAALARPDLLALTSPAAALPLQGLNDRLERAIEAVENAREAVIGAFDIFTTQMAQRTNRVLQVLTVVTVALLPATVVTGLMGMSLKAHVYQTGDRGFWSVCGLILLVAAAVLLLARRRRWL
jgi:magnesium/cobalt transport protein CorA